MSSFLVTFVTKASGHVQIKWGDRPNFALIRTIADLAGAVDIQITHIAEVIQYRMSRTILFSAFLIGMNLWEALAVMAGWKTCFG